ncbi:MAG: tetratricopeptide repeat protein, partial [Thermodesulfovibrionales bacterium]|nr:tetratricopeptide repeat protein [Thermodesulfovibrionales bacterium]
MQFYKGRIVIFLLIIFLLSFLAYSRTFNGEFQFDDDISVIENPYVNGASKFSWHNLAGSIGNGARPFTAITFALNYQFGGLDVRWYHITNFIIHIFNGALIFSIVLLTMRSSKLPAHYTARASSVALISTAIFLLHPIQTEAVSYISQRYESLSSLFYLCSLLAYIEARLTPSLTLPHRGGGRGGWATRYPLLSTRSMLYAVSIISGFLALGSKEIAITLPVVMLLYDFYFLEDRPFLKRIAGPGIFMLLSFVAGIFIVSGFSKGIDAGFSVRAFTPWEYLLTQFRVIATYIRLLFLPIYQNLDYDFRISRTFFEVDTFLSFVFLLMLMSSALLFFKKWRLGSFFILWFFIILAPTSSIVPVIDVIFEHRIYLASAGIFIIVSDILSRWISMQKEGATYNRTAICIVAILIVLLSVATFQRNRVWETKLSLWEDAAKKSPMKSRVHNNLGNCYMLHNKHFGAIEEYKKAIALDSNNVEAYYNLGLNLENVGMLNQAVYYYDIFYKIAPASYDRHKEIVRKRIDSF